MDLKTNYIVLEIMAFAMKAQRAYCNSKLEVIFCKR